MIAGCPKCSARYRVDLEQIGEAGAKLRCTKCSAVFLVRAPQVAAPDVAPVPEPLVAPQTESPVARESAPPLVEETTASDRPVQVLVADPSEERGKQTVTAIESWGLTAMLVPDGVEAMLGIQRAQPDVVVLDAALPKMFGFQVCEVVKRNESLRHMNVVLVGAIHHQDRYRRGPSDLYGADVYLEQPDLPDGLLPLLRDAGLAIRDDASTAAAAPPVATESAPSLEFDEAALTDSPVAASEPVVAKSVSPEVESSSLEFLEEPPAAPPVAVEPTPDPVPVAEEDPELAAERERAERLARIAVSEMLLYQPEKFDQAIRDGNIEAVLDLEIGEARALIRQRISEEIRAEKDFILVELERVAQERGGAN